MRRLVLAIAASLVFAPAAGAHTLSYGKAKRALQAKAYELERQSEGADIPLDALEARVTAVVRVSRHRYRAKARWTGSREVICRGCGYSHIDGKFGFDITVLEPADCSAKLLVRFRSRSSRRLVVRVTDNTC